MRKIVLFVTLALTTFISQAQNISTIAGSVNFGFGGDGGPATSAELNNPLGVCSDANGNVFISDYGNNRVRLVDQTGTIYNYGGNGTPGYSGDGGPATAAEMHGPGEMSIGDSGKVYFPELLGARVRYITTSGMINTYAGDGNSGFGGDGGPATAAQLSFPTDVSFDTVGNMYIADDGNNRIRKVTRAGIISTIAGIGIMGFSGDGGPATAAELNNPTGVCADLMGNIYIGDQSNNRVRMVDTNGIINTIAGDGSASFGGDNGLATSAQLNHPLQVVVDAIGNVYIDDVNNNAIRMINTNGIITTVAGIGTQSGFSGDGGLATAAELSGPQGVWVDAYSNIFIADYGNNRIREVIPGPLSTSIIKNTATFTVYPNPTSEEVYINLQGNKGQATVGIYDLTGREVARQLTNTSHLAINVGALAKGTYLVRVQAEDGGTYLKKLEISR